MGMTLFSLSYFKWRYVLGDLEAEWLILAVGLFVLPIGWYLGVTLRKKEEKLVSEPEPESPGVEQVVLDQLSKREKEVLIELCLGKSNAEIADALHISLATVKTHVSNILSKTGMERRTQLIRICSESSDNQNTSLG